MKMIKACLKAIHNPGKVRKHRLRKVTDNILFILKKQVLLKAIFLTHFDLKTLGLSSHFLQNWLIGKSSG